MSIKDLNDRVSAARAATEARGETFYPGASRIHLASFPPKERWDDWVELDSKAWPERVEKRYMLGSQRLMEHGATHGNWWNATVWGECRNFAGAYMAEIAEWFPSAAELASEADDPPVSAVALRDEAASA